MPAAFENVQESLEIRSLVNMRVFDRVADAGLSCEVTCGVKFMLAEYSRKQRQIAQVAFISAISGVGVEEGVAIALERNGIVVVEVVQADNFVALVKQRLRHMHPNESGRPRNKYFSSHDRCFSEFERI